MSLTLIWPFNVIQSQIDQVNRKAIYDLLFVFHTNFDHTMYRFWDISWNRSQKSKLDLSDLENDL